MTTQKTSFAQNYLKSIVTAGMFVAASGAMIMSSSTPAAATGGCPTELFLITPDDPLTLLINEEQFGTRALCDAQGALTRANEAAARNNSKDVSNNAINRATRNQGGAVPLFGIFSSGRLAHTEHDSFKVRQEGAAGIAPTRTFGVDEWSATISVELNLTQVVNPGGNGLFKIGFFGGTMNADVGLDDNGGGGDNMSYLLGTYALVTSGPFYGLVMFSGNWGDSDVRILNTVANGTFSTGSYDTHGHTIAGTFGMIMPFVGGAQLDLRSGLIYSMGTGDDFTDSAGTFFGSSHANVFAGGLSYSVFTTTTIAGMPAKPYIRNGVIHRFVNENFVNAAPAKFEYGEADTFVFLEGGLVLAVNESLQWTSKVRADKSGDSSTYSAQFGFKFKLN